MNYEIVNGITLEDFQRLRKDAGWKQLSDEQAEHGLAHSYKAFSAVSDGNVIGMARLLWDKGYCAYLTDVIVDERYRSSGIGTELVRRLLDTLKRELKDGWDVKVVLLSAKGREGFYERLGFSKRPNETFGCGMDMWLNNKSK